MRRFFIVGVMTLCSFLGASNSDPAVAASSKVQALMYVEYEGAESAVYASICSGERWSTPVRISSELPSPACVDVPQIAVDQAVVLNCSLPQERMRHKTRSLSLVMGKGSSLGIMRR